MICRKILNLLGVVILALATLLAQLNPPALAQSPQVTTNVQAVLASESTARVIVALRQPETRAGVGVSVQQMAQSQEGVLNALSAEDFRLIHKYETLPGLAGEVSEAGLAALLDRPEVAAIALDLPVEAALIESAALIKADLVWRDFGLTGAGVNVAMLDTGIDAIHPDLADNIVAQHCFNRGFCPPDDTDESDNAQDENGHGTHVTGIITSRGESSPRGIAPDTGIVAVRVLGSSGSGFTSDVLAGIDWVVANQARLNIKVINLSLGGGSYTGVCDQADANTMLYVTAVEAAREAGITVFAASGNSREAEAMMAPACISGVVSVGNVYDTDLDHFTWPGCLDQGIVVDQVACASNSSSVLDLLAPGVSIDSTALGGGQGNKSGTSMSTAHAAAITALMLQAKPDLTPAEIETILEETGLPVMDSRNGRITPRIDALAAVRQVTGSEVDALSGTVLLQGRTDHSGTDLFLSQTPCSTVISGTVVATTGTEGKFEIKLPDGQNYQCLQTAHDGYLVGQQSSPVGDLGVITLPGGDVTGDGMIDIFDLAFIAARYGGNDPTADITADGAVDILDLVIAAGNYNQAGPVSDWE